MATEAELAFADQVGRFYARQYSLPPVTGRVFGWRLICAPPGRTAAEIAEALHTSRSAVGNAIAMAESMGQIQRTRTAGERADRVSFHPDAALRAIESSDEYSAMLSLARQGLDLLSDAPAARRARLLELAALSECLLERRPPPARQRA